MVRWCETVRGGAQAFSTEWRDEEEAMADARQAEEAAKEAGMAACSVGRNRTPKLECFSPMSLPFPNPKPNGYTDSQHAVQVD